MDTRLRDALTALQPSPERPVVFLTGAGFSVASGIPTFRGEEGYWTVDSKVYHPQELATKAAYRKMPRQVWQWYLYRKAICNQAEPNASHQALVALEQSLGDAFCLITQNVDGLHRRAGTSDARMCEVHGDIDLMRDEDSGEREPIPAHLAKADKTAQLTDAEWAELWQPDGPRFRPHILWFDEYYEERFHKSETAMRRAASACLFVVVGTSGAASLPIHAAAAAAEAGAVFVDVNPADNPFRDFARRYGRGFAMDTDALSGVRELCEVLAG
ncbi:MAG: RNA polymerase subunit sigma [Deltaproteobacteria bacterium]|nr:MAG: RNA polymerase subunit sigma [Deltaproteobacteria bacterium]